MKKTKRINKRIFKVGPIFCPTLTDARARKKEWAKKGFKGHIRKWKAGYRLYLS